MSKKIKNQVGKKYGRLTVVRRGEDIIASSGRKYITWYCNCDCGNKNILVKANSLFSGNTKSCGCYKKEIANQNVAKANSFPKKKDYEKKRQENKYEFFDEYVIGYTSNTNNCFYIDKEDYDKVKKYYWHEDYFGSISTSFKDQKSIFLHRYIMNCNDENIVIDHINHNKKDNRKANLRYATSSNNSMNRIKTSKNTTGYVGVVYANDRKKKWRAYITVSRKKIYLGGFYTKEEAVHARKQAEQKYFGKYSYDNSMKIAKKFELEKENKQYGME